MFDLSGGRIRKAASGKHPLGLKGYTKNAIGVTVF
jgi:hypothetical protein